MRAGDLESRAPSRSATTPSEVIDGWSHSRAFDAGEALDDHPELAGNRSVVLDWAFEEYCQRIDRGERVDADGFAHRFADVEHSLLGLIQARQFLQENLSVLQGLAEVSWPATGSDFAGYELLDELGRGAFSRVFVARERALGDRIVVAKVCWRGGEEAMRLGRLEHPGIMPVHSVHADEASGLNVIVMPLLGRTTLAAALDAAGVSERPPTRAAAFWRNLDSRSAVDRNGAAADVRPLLRPRHAYETTIVRLGIKLAEALVYAHGKGVVHGDIKPSNVLLLPTGDAVLMDFNLSFEREANLERAGGTLPYMPPELLTRMQRSPAAPTGPAVRPDERSDVFSLGATLYECLTGRLPFGTIPEGSRQQIVTELLERRRRGPRPLREWNERIDPNLDELICSCLAFDPADRPSSADELARRLRSAVSWLRRAWHAIHCRPRVSAGLFAVLLLAVGLTAYSIATLPPYSVRQLEQGWAAESQGDYASAIGHYTEALASDPNLHDARFSRACAYLLNDERRYASHALQDFQKLRELCDDGRVAAGFGYSLCLADGQAKIPSVWFRRAVDRGLDTPEVLTDLGYCELKLGHLSDAASILSDAVQRRPDSLVAHYNLAEAEFQLALRHNELDVKRRFVASALEHANAAIDLAATTGIVSPHLYFLLATIHANAVPFTIAEDQPHYVKRALEFSKRAVDLGLNAKRLDRLLQECPRLSEDEQFRQLQSARPRHSEPPDLPRLLNPVAEFPPPRHLSCQSDNPDRLHAGL